jgi:hypothetical protein
VCKLYAENGVTAGHQWLTAVILATQEAEIRSIANRSQPRQIVLRNPILKKLFTKKGLWSGSRYRPWVQAPIPQKKKKRCIHVMWATFGTYSGPRTNPPIDTKGPLSSPLSRDNHEFVIFIIYLFLYTYRDSVNLCEWDHITQTNYPHYFKIPRKK